MVHTVRHIQKVVRGANNRTGRLKNEAASCVVVGGVCVRTSPRRRRVHVESQRKGGECEFLGDAHRRRRDSYIQQRQARELLRAVAHLRRKPRDRLRRRQDDEPRRRRVAAHGWGLAVCSSRRRRSRPSAVAGARGGIPRIEQSVGDAKLHRRGGVACIPYHIHL